MPPSRARKGTWASLSLRADGEAWTRLSPGTVREKSGVISTEVGEELPLEAEGKALTWSYSERADLSL